MDLLQQARQYLTAYMRGKPNRFDTVHPWRQDWQFGVLHSLRIEAYVLKILAGEDHKLSPAEVELLRLAAILHDLARLDQRENHARLGAQLAHAWLLEQSGLPLADIERVADLIAVHSNKSQPEPDFCKAVLKDADTLDEIGIMSVFMAANWLPQSPFFFSRLRQRLVERELPFCDQKMALLNTAAARTILQQRRAFVCQVIDQLDNELAGVLAEFD